MKKSPQKIAKQIPKHAKKSKQQPGHESEMKPKPLAESNKRKLVCKLENKVAVITGGDSGIGHATALLFAKEGADIAIIYLNEHRDAKRVKKEIETIGRNCLLVAGDVSKERFCQTAIKKIVTTFGKINILINNAAEQHPQKNFEKITGKQMRKTFETNIFAYFYMVKAVLPYLKKGSCVINTASVTAYRGSDHLIDYSATKGAIVAFTRSLSKAFIKKGIRVNGVAPGPIWTPLITSTFSKEHIKKFGKNTPMERPGQPEEVAPSYLFLATDDSSYMTGQFLHPNGGEVINT